MVFIVRQEDFQEGVSIHGYFIVRQGGFQEGDSMVFYCETTRISRGRLYGFLFRVEENFKPAAICFFIARKVEFQERTSMALNVGRKEFQKGASAYMVICN